MCQVSTVITPSIITLKKNNRGVEGKQGATNQQALQTTAQRDQMLLGRVLLG